ncbi:MAG: hypothetical protein GXX96_37860 [Planctomycetaceae bacterium]|nr:hypothetical protein [Planctomycetaceae bacterium]
MLAAPSLRVGGWQFTGNVGINPFWTGAQRTVFRTTVDDGVTVLIDQVSISTAASSVPQP